jgi:glycosyltransferase involved in cell wall biosynthesis
MIDRIPDTPPLIAPVDRHIERPQWSVMIPAYNCSRYLADTIQSVLVQDQGPARMQIEVIDDHSTDADVESLVKDIGKGRVGFFRQEKNVGSLRNFETCLNRSKGKWIHLLHGDDLVEPGFYKEIESLFTKFPEAGAAFTGHSDIDANGKFLYHNRKILDEPGIINNWLLKIARSQKVQPPSIVVRRNVYEQLGGFFAVHYGEDWEMWTRIAANFPVAHSPKHLALYRIHNNNITSRSFLSGQCITDINKVIDIIQEYIPEEDKKSVKKYAKKHFSKYFARMSDKIYHDHEHPEIAIAQAERALKMNMNNTTLYFLLKMYVKRLIRYDNKNKTVQ